MKTLIIICATTLTASLALADNAVPKPQEGASTVSFSKDKDGNKNIAIHNHSYLFADTVYVDSGKDSKPSAFLISQDFTSSTQMNSDTPPVVKLKAQVWVGSSDFPTKPLWTIETEGDSAAIEDRFYAVTHDGFQDLFDIYHYFRMADGKLAYTSNTPLLIIYSNSEQGLFRYIGYQDQFADNELPKAMTDKKIAGIVSYGDDHGVMKKIGIFGWPSDDEPSPPNSYLIYEKERIEGREIYLRDNKESGAKALGHFSVVIAMSEGIEAEIPFENDVPQLDKARLPKGFTVELLP